VKVACRSNAFTLHPTRPDSDTKKIQLEGGAANLRSVAPAPRARALEIAERFDASRMHHCGAAPVECSTFHQITIRRFTNIHSFGVSLIKCVDANRVRPRETVSNRVRRRIEIANIRPAAPRKYPVQRFSLLRSSHQRKNRP
jgi:hypothetical protein